MGCPPGAEGGWGAAPSSTPAAPRGRNPARPTLPAAPGPRGRGDHTELRRFMRPRKVDRLCRPVDTELMAERWAPLHRQRCEGVSL